MSATIQMLFGRAIFPISVAIAALTFLYILARLEATCDHETASTAAKTHGHRVKGGSAGRRMRSAIADPPSRLAYSIGQTCSCSSRS